MTNRIKELFGNLMDEAKKKDGEGEGEGQMFVLIDTEEETMQAAKDVVIAFKKANGKDLPAETVMAELGCGCHVMRLILGQGEDAMRLEFDATQANLFGLLISRSPIAQSGLGFQFATIGSLLMAKNAAAQSSHWHVDKADAAFLDVVNKVASKLALDGSLNEGAGNHKAKSLDGDPVNDEDVAKVRLDPATVSDEQCKSLVDSVLLQHDGGVHAMFGGHMNTETHEVSVLFFDQENAKVALKAARSGGKPEKITPMATVKSEDWPAMHDRLTTYMAGQKHVDGNAIKAFDAVGEMMEKAVAIAAKMKAEGAAGSDKPTLH